MMYIEKDVSEELALIEKLRDELDTLVTIIDEWGPLPRRTLERFSNISHGLAVLGFMFQESKTYLIIRDTDTGEETIKYFSEGDYSVFYEASKHYAFSDLDSTYEITKIMFEGRECAYCGWDFGMHFVYRYKDTREIAFENSYPQWDH